MVVAFNVRSPREVNISRTATVYEKELQFELLLDGICKHTDIKYEDIYIRRGVRQECLLSAQLLNLYPESIFNETLEDREKRVNVNAGSISDIKNAQDNKVNESSKQF